MGCLRDLLNREKQRILPLPQLRVPYLLYLVNPVAAEEPTSMPLVPVFPKQSEQMRCMDGRTYFPDVTLV